MKFEYPGYSMVLMDLVTFNINDDSSNAVVDVAINPGENVFLVAYKSNVMYLFSENESTPKMAFEPQ